MQSYGLKIDVGSIPISPSPTNYWRIVMITSTPRLVTEIEIFEACKYIIKHVAPYRATQMVLEIAHFPFEDLVEQKLLEAGQIYAQSFA